MNKKVVLVTGASSGIGEAISEHLAVAGHQVVAGARRVDRLEALAKRVHAAGGGIDTRALDVTDQAAVKRFVTGAVDDHDRIDVIVNNAGVMPLSRLDRLLVDEWNQMLDVNVRGLLHGIAEALPVFQRQGSGHFITIASIGAHQVSPAAAVY